MQRTSFLTAVIMALVVSAGPARAGKTPPDGRALFHRHCSVCHGDEAIGQSPKSRPQGGMDEDGTLIAPALNGNAHAWHHGPDVLYDYVKSGSVDPESPMPSFGSRLSDAEIRAIIGYFQSLWPEKIREEYEERFPGGMFLPKSE